jgi:hypothetical protein
MNKHKMIKKPYLYPVVAMVTMLTACANPVIVRVSPDTYMLAREAHGGIFASAASMKADVLKEASDFAEKQGKVAVPIAVKERPAGIAQWAAIEYQFRVVDKNDPEVRRTQLIHDPNIIIQRTDPDVQGQTQVQRSSDVYENLLKLDELKKRGVIAESEFQEEKKRLLQSVK